MRPRVATVLAIVAVLLGGVTLVPATYTRLTGAISRGEKIRTPPTLAAGPVSVEFNGEFFSWALMDRRTGEISGAKNMTSTNSTESMIKIWFASDYLRQLGDKPLSVERKKQIQTAIRDSDDDAANALYKASGSAKSITRMVRTCGLTDTKPGTVPGYIGWWSFTQMSSRDAVRLGDCVADGRAAGSTWTKFVLGEMARVRGTVLEQRQRSGGGHWGIIDGLPESITSQSPVSIKNGWTRLNYDGNWHVNCLAVADKWSLAVMMRYPASISLSYGAKVCATVAAQLVTPQPGAAPKVPQEAVRKL